MKQHQAVKTDLEGVTEPQHHAVITGVGRAGTSFLIELCTHLGLDTGFNEETLKSKKDPVGRAGLETSTIRYGSPYIIKSPWFIDIIKPIMNDSRMSIDHIFVPVRDAFQSAESRRTVTRSGSGAGALWHTKSMKKGDQEEVLIGKLYDLILALSMYDTPVTLINYPRLTQDSEYLYNKLKPILKDITFEKFDEVYKRVLDPSLVHDYKE